MSPLTPTAHAILAAASQIIAFPSSWSQGARARDAAANPVDPLSPSAVSWCPAGAIELATHRLFFSCADSMAEIRARSLALETLNRTVRDLTAGKYQDFSSYNDNNHHNRIKEAIDIAANYLRAVQPKDPR